MDTVWAQRKIYDEARILRDKQDAYCERIASREVVAEPFPDDLRLEALVDVLRGRVKVQTHCYEAVDLDAFVRISNEFKFSIAVFHHAHEAYLVPEVLKKAYGKPPAIAMFAAFSRYKREAYRHSEFAPRVLASHGLKVVMKSDHPAIQSRYLLHEAQQAHYWGLPASTALSSVTVHAAEVLGLDHRIGYVREGYDAGQSCGA
jgi:imidazolonepropionase-like amidohydrolase